MNLRCRYVVAAGVLILGLAACDTSPPTFTVQPHLGYTVGTQIGESDLTDVDDPEDPWDDPHYDDFTTPIYRHLYWEAADAEGCEIRYDVEEIPVGDVPTLILEDVTATDVVLWDSDYNGDFGGGSQDTLGWRVIAHDCAGNTRVSGPPEMVYASPNVWQETGENGQNWGPAEPHPVGYTGTWTTLAGPWASGGQVKYSTEPGASVTFQHDFIADQHIALVMSQGPTRGSADIYVDDVKVTTVNTLALENSNRIIVFDRKMTAGTHTLRVVNRGTFGHPRIDVDAFLT
jgi:hypothetical protein